MTPASTPRATQPAPSSSAPSAEPRPWHEPTTGRFRNPWPGSRVRGGWDLLRWFGQRLVTGVAFRRDRSRFTPGNPAYEPQRAARDVLTATWVGHSTMLLQLGSVTLLTDPVWSRRASPMPLLGPKRRVPAAIRFRQLPPVDLTLVSHNHYDHLDRRTVRRLRRRAPDMPWIAPLGVGKWLRERGVREAWELDWWDTLHVGGAVVTAVPARHFSARGVRDRNATLWCGFVIEAAGWRVLFAGDSGMHGDWRQLGERLGPFDVIMLPIGAYEPRWFMEVVHMNPEEAVAAYAALREGSESARRPRGAPPVGKMPAPRHPPVMLPIHWGTFKLTDEPLDEPPARLRAAWAAAALEPDALWIPRHGDTLRLQRSA